MNQERTRRLAAIMFTDIQGYTALMQQDERQAIQYREKHRAIFNSMTEKHHGKVLQYFGDGTLSVFDSAIDAVNCGIEMQLGFQAEPAIPVRIGIHSGDVIFTTEEIIGDGVNVAARIESLAVAGSVFISDKVYDEIKNQESITASMLKTFKLKNVEKPVQVYAVTNAGLIVPDPEDIGGKGETAASLSPGSTAKSRPGLQKRLPIVISIATIAVILLLLYLKFGSNPAPATAIQDKSIAVLAFDNMSGDPEQEYFSDGISEEILNALVNIEGLKVAGRTSAFSFKGKNEDIRTIGDKLDVSMILEGSVRKDANQVRIVAQLINVEDGFHIWSETYDREMADIFTVQQDIANQIVEKLKLHVQAASNLERGTANVAAYELFLKGSYFFKRGLEGTIKAMEYFEQAVELDPDYAEAYSFIGESYLHLAGYNAMSSGDAYARSRAAAQKAITINPYEPRAHKVLAYIHLFYDWDWEATLSEYDKAIQYGLPEQNEFITYCYIFLNKDYDRAIRVSEQMLESNPLDVVSHWQVGLCYYFAERFEEALVCFNNALELDPNYSDAHHYRGIVLAYLGQYDAAVVALEKALEISQGQGLAGLDLVAVDILRGNHVDAEEVIRSGEYIDPGDAARLYTLLGNHDEAIFWLEKAYRERSVMLVTIKNFWVWDPLRDDPRFVEIYDKMQF